MTALDERDFLGFLRDVATIQIFESAAPSRDRMVVEEFAPREEGHWQYFI